MDTLPDPPSDLDDLVLRAVTLIEERGLQALDELCAHNPVQAGALRRRIARLQDTGLLRTGARGREFPERLGDFRLLGVIGGGGMGIVYRAEQVSLGREVALKLVKPEHLYFAGARERFHREVEIIAGLAHPGIVPVYAVGEADGVPYFAMERVHGASLHELLEHARRGCADAGALTGADFERALRELVPDGEHGGSAEIFRGTWEEACLRVLREVAEALEHAHRRGVVHRDVKPSNVLVTPAGRVMLLDFGLSSTLGSDRLTRTGTAVGSIPYMSPEQVRGAELDARTDVYSLGVTLYEMLALRLPFAGDSALEVAERIQWGDAAPLRSLNARLSWEGVTIVATAMERDRGRRYAAAADMARDLGHALARRPIEARPAGALLRARRWLQRHPAKSVAVAAAFLLLVVAPSVFAWEKVRASRVIAAQRDDLAGANRALASALADAQTQRSVAERNFAAAKRAVDEMLRRVADEILPDIPLMHRVRQELVAAAIAFYEDFVRDRPDHPSLLLETGEALHSLSDLYGQAGRSQDMEAALAREDELLDRAEAAYPRDPEVRRRRAELSGRHGLNALLQGRGTEAEAHLQRALELLDGLDEGHTEVRWTRAKLRDNVARAMFAAGKLAEGREALEASIVDWTALVDGNLVPAKGAEAEPQRFAAMHRLAVSLARLGVNLRAAAARAGRAERRELLNGARAHLHESVRLLRTLHAEEPTDVASALDLGRSLDSLANAMAPEDTEVAEGCRREAIEIYRAMVRDHPEVVRAAADLGSALANLAGTLAMTFRSDEANACLREAVQHLEHVVELQPSSVDWQIALGGALLNLGNMLESQGELHEARVHLDRAVHTAGIVTAARPRDPQATMLATGAAFCSASVLLKLDEPEPAAAQVRTVLGSQPSPEALPRAANMLANCAAAARERELADAATLATWERDAVQALAAALERGGTTRDAVLRDQGAAALRALPAAKALLESGGAPGK